MQSYTNSTTFQPKRFAYSPQVLPHLHFTGQLQQSLNPNTDSQEVHIAHEVPLLATQGRIAPYQSRLHGNSNNSQRKTSRKLHATGISSNLASATLGSITFSKYPRILHLTSLSPQARKSKGLRFLLGFPGIQN